MECMIREWRLKDAPLLAAALNNRSVQNNLRDGIPYPYTESDADSFIRVMISADTTKTFAFAITVDDKAVGSIGVFRKDNIHNRTAELGYFVAEQYWGMGLGTSAVKQIVRYVFDNTDIVRIFAEPFDYNVASCRILEKSGFLFEGTLRSNAVKNGRIFDMKLYSLVKEPLTEL